MVMANASTRRAELDILKAIAVIGVILIHVVSQGLFSLPRGSVSFNFLLLLDQLFRFCVPLFVAISGFTLALKYSKHQLVLSEFLTRRVLRLLPWYLFFSCLIYLYLHHTHWYFGSAHSPLWKVIFLGKGDYHLYFVPMIFTLYLLFPLLNRVKSAILLLVPFLLFQIVFYQILTLQSLEKIELGFFKGDQQQYLFAGTWIFYFVLGIVLFRLKNSPSSFVKSLSLSALCLGFFWMVWQCFNLSSSLDLNVVTRSTRLSVLLYSSAFVVCCIFYKEKLLALNKKLLNFLAGIGSRSYVIYLMHTLFLRIFLTYIPPTSTINLVLIALLTVVVCDYVAQILQSILAKGIRARVFGSLIKR